MKIIPLQQIIKHVRPTNTTSGIGDLGLFWLS